jgi:transcriptional regulator with XRE-family HTH domain
VRTISSRRHKTLVKWLREERIAKGLSQSDLAKCLGEHQSWVARLESGQRRLDVIELLIVAKAIGFDAAKMVRRLTQVRENNSKPAIQRAGRAVRT